MFFEEIMSFWLGIHGKSLYSGLLHHPIPQFFIPWRKICRKLFWVRLRFLMLVPLFWNQG